MNLDKLVKPLRSSVIPLSSIARLWFFIPKQQKQKLFLTFFLMTVVSLLEIFSIGAIIPFLTVVSSGDLSSSKVLLSLINFLSLSSNKDLLVFFTGVFCLAIVLSSFSKFLLLKLNTTLSFKIGSEISKEIYSKVLYQPYQNHTSQNSSEIINTITFKVNALIYNIILPSLALINAILLLSLIFLSLFYFKSFISLFTFLACGIIYAFITYKTKSVKISNSKIVANESTKLIKALQEGLGGIRDILLDNSQWIYCLIYENAQTKLRDAQAQNQIIAQSPRFFIETFGVIVIASLVFYFSTTQGGVIGSIPILGVLALGAQRLLPLMQQAYVALSSIQGGQASLDDVLILLNLPSAKILENSNSNTRKKISFSKDLAIENLGFRFTQNQEFIFKDLNLSIKKGSRIGIIGKTGSGKTTLMDILMGLLKPTIGSILVDGKKISNKNMSAWQARIAHVPQFIYLTDGSIAENIAFGVSSTKINYEKIKLCLERAKLLDFVNKLPDKYQTIVGERGIKLSGGQRQRIGIARAFYKNADVLIFDEATSSLDSATEESVMSSIEAFDIDITIFIVAHRMSTLKKCDQIIEISGGQVTFKGNYNKFIKSH